jgi:hypothetical protein
MLCGKPVLTFPENAIIAACPDNHHPIGVTLTDTSSFCPPETKTTPSIGATSQ